MKITKVIFGTAVCLILSSCLATGVDPLQPSLSMAPDSEFAGIFSKDNQFCWDSSTTPIPVVLPACVAQNTEVIYSFATNETWVRFDAETRELSTDGPIPRLTTIVQGTYRCESQRDPTLYAEKSVVLDDCDGDGIPDHIENINAYRPFLSSTVTTRLTPQNYDTYTAGGRIPQGMSTAAGEDVSVFDSAGDLDNDTRTNLDEFLAGTDPLIATYPVGGGGTNLNLNGTALQFSLASADMNNDGYNDIIAGTDFLLGPPAAVFVLVYLFDPGTNTFLGPITTVFPTFGGRVNAVSVADFNGNGAMDVAALNPQGGNAIYIALGNNTGQLFTLQTIILAQPISPAANIADLNRDGFPDYAIASQPNIINIFLWNPATDQFPALPSFTYSTGAGTFLRGLTYGNFDGDENDILDLAVYETTNKQVIVFTGDGTGQFTQGGSFNLNAPQNLLSILSCDINNDENPDLIVGTVQDARPMRILLGNGDGTFQAPLSPVGLNNLELTKMRAADFDGDNLVDIMISDFTNAQMVVAINDGAGDFTTLTFGGGQIHEGLTAADFNVDGMIDIAFTTTNVPPGIMANAFLQQRP